METPSLMLCRTIAEIDRVGQRIREAGDRAGMLALVAVAKLAGPREADSDERLDVMVGELKELRENLGRYGETMASCIDEIRRVVEAGGASCRGDGV